MFIRQNIQTLRFFRTTPAMRCPYLPHRLETKLVTELSGPDAISQHDTLTDAGFRRSHHFVYKPLCDGCRACVSVRVLVNEFQPGRTMRRVLARNSDLSGAPAAPQATSEQYSLFRGYVDSRHGDGGRATAPERVSQHSVSRATQASSSTVAAALGLRPRRTPGLRPRPICLASSRRCAA